jgi:DNA polymerase III subunit chi
VTEVFFYHLEAQPLEKVLPKLLSATLERGWKAVVETDSPERAEALSSVLWTFADDAFLPHGTSADGSPERQPIWLTASSENPNTAKVRFYVDGAEPSQVEGLDRAVIMFNGADEAAVAKARDDWKRFKSEGHAISYWQQDEGGRWQNRAKG